MNRYQIYLNPKSVDILDNLSKIIKSSRSQIIREVIDEVALKYEKLLKRTEIQRIKNNPLLKMAGAAKSGNPGISRSVNEIYLKD